MATILHKMLSLAKYAETGGRTLDEYTASTYLHDVRSHLLSEGRTVVPKVVYENNGQKTLSGKIEVEHMEAANIQSTTLIEEEVYDTILAGLEPATCFEEAMMSITVSADSLRWVKSAATNYAERVPEGTAPAVDNVSYEDVTFNLERYAIRPLITEHLIESGLFDIVEFRLRQAGIALANAYNREALDVLVDGISTNSVTEGTTGAMKVSDIAEARAKVTANNAIPDTLVMYPTAEGNLLADSNLVYASYAGNDRVLRTGALTAPLLGMRPFVCNVTTSSSTSNTWGDSSSGDIKAMVYDAKHPAAAMATQELKVRQFTDPLRSLHNIIVERWFDCQMLEEKAACVIVRK